MTVTISSKVSLNNTVLLRDRMRRTARAPPPPPSGHVRKNLGEKIWEKKWGGVEGEKFEGKKIGDPWGENFWKKKLGQPRPPRPPTGSDIGETILGNKIFWDPRQADQWHIWWQNSELQVPPQADQWDTWWQNSELQVPPPPPCVQTEILKTLPSLKLRLRAVIKNCHSLRSLWLSFFISGLSSGAVAKWIKKSLRWWVSRASILNGGLNCIKLFKEMRPRMPNV